MILWVVEKYSMVSDHDRSASSTPALHDHSHRSHIQENSKSNNREDNEENGMQYSNL